MTGIKDNSFITVMDEDEEDPFVDVIINLQTSFVFPFLIQSIDVAPANQSPTEPMRARSL